MVPSSQTGVIMKLEDKVIAVESLFHRLDYYVSEFQRNTGLKCLNNCCKCCKYPNISATVLEFLPMANYIIKQKSFRVWQDRIINNTRDEGASCAILKLLSPWKNLGRCAIYHKRGLICRLFGFSAVLNKDGCKMLSTCSIIKKIYPHTISEVNQKINEDLTVPVMKDFYFRLMSIDFNLAHHFFPINMALLKALEIVDKKNSFYYSIFKR
jgi:Fe-S-cluster containining protein